MTRAGEPCTEINGRRASGPGVLARARLSPSLAVLLAPIALAIAPGCASSGPGGPAWEERSIELLLRAGEFGVARQKVHSARARDPRDRNFLLDRVKLAALTLADGATPAAGDQVEHVYDLLRQQGVNRDNTAATFFFGERGTRVWRGEPFEQALAYYYVGLYDGLTGDWGNVRAVCQNALFGLRDFGQMLRRGGERGSAGAREVNRASDTDLRAEAESLDAMLADRRALIAESRGRAGDGELGVEYQVADSDFELAYVLKAIATRQLGEMQQSEEAIAALRRVAPRLEAYADGLTGVRYNSVLVVDYGVGPEKFGAGPSNAIAVFRPRTRSDDAELVVTIDSAPARRFPVVTDVNRMAQDLRWNNLEDLRLAKVAIGDAMIYGGLIGASVSKDDQAQLAGLGIAALGAIFRSTAQADTRHNDALPQRIYVATLWLDSARGELELMVDGQPASRLVVPYVRPEDPSEIVMWYARLSEAPGRWSSAGRVLYSNDATGEVEGLQLPYILGGRCVRTPSPETLASYHASGFLHGLGVEDLRGLYREEGIAIADFDTPGAIGRHVLEGGDALYTPGVGSTAFARLIGVEHRPYVPRSKRCQELAAECAAGIAGAGPGVSPGVPEPD
jgi:hypothetical protein